MADLLSAVRARGGWTEAETKALFEEARLAGDEGRSVKSAFDIISEKTGRKPNSIRNYYYLKLKENGGETKAQFTPFNDDEVGELLRQMLTGQAEGRSVRSIAMSMAKGDKRIMLRYQNKYRSLLRAKPMLIEDTVKELENSGCRCLNPLKARSVETDVCEIIPDLLKNLSRSGIDCSGLLSGLSALASAAASGGEERLSTQLGKTMSENACLKNKLDKLIALNRSFLETDGISRLTGLGEYVEALSRAIYEQ